LPTVFHRSRAFQLSAGNHAALSGIDRTMNGARDSPISNGSVPIWLADDPCAAGQLSATMTACYWDAT